MALMEPNAEQAFNTAMTGASHNGALSASMTAGSLYTLITLIIATIAITWFAWVCVGAYKSWAQRDLRPYDAMWLALRGIGVLSLTVFLFR